MVTLRWREPGGAFNAQDARVVHVMKTTVASIDSNQAWLPLEKLQAMARLPGEATMVVLAPGTPPPGPLPGWTFRDNDYLLRDLRELVKAKSYGRTIFLVIFLSLGMLAIFDTQVLAIFRRRREIGTLIALGFTRGQVIRLFTLEGALHGILAVILGALYGLPLLWLQARAGFAVPGRDRGHGHIHRRENIPGIQRRSCFVHRPAGPAGYDRGQLPAHAAHRPPEAHRRPAREDVMIRFLCLGLWRDRSRSLFPLLTVILGVTLTVVMFTWIKGFEVNFLQTSARLGSGHVAVMSRAYAAEADQLPNDLALTGTAELQERLRREFPAFAWTPRIRFAGLLDIPDEKGETRVQGPVGGLAVDLFSGASPEPGILDLEPALVSGSLPGKKGEILLAHDFASRLGIAPGATATMIVGTMYGGTSTANFTVTGTFRFGAPAMDRAMAIIDIADARAALDMDDAAGEIVGFFRAGFYDRAGGRTGGRAASMPCTPPRRIPSRRGWTPCCN